MNRIQVNNRRFGYKVGSLVVAFKEYGTRVGDGRLLSFAVLRDRFFEIEGQTLCGPYGTEVDRKQIRALILQKMGASRECE